MNDLSPTRPCAGRLLLGGFAYVLLALVPLTTYAGVAYQTPKYSGVASGIYKGPAPVASGSISTPATLNFGGRSITVPASARLAANATTYAASALRLTPYGLLSAAATSWLLSQGIQATPEGQVVSEPPVDVSNMTATQAAYYLSAGGYNYDNRAAIDICYSRGFLYFFITAYGASYRDLGCMSQTGWYDILGWPSSTFPAPPPPLTRPATDEDYNRLAAGPLPDTVADELADTHGIPVDNPQIAPGDVATGSPYRKPDGSWAQPRAKITPMPDGSVAISPYEVPVDAPAGEPQPQPDFVPADQPTVAGTETQPDPCDLNPDRVGCAKLGEPTDQPVDKSSRAMSYAPEPVSMPGVCPAPKQVVTPFGIIALSYDPACQFAGMIRPVVLALGLFAASMIFVGGLRNG